MNTKSLLTMLKAHYGGASDYRIAKIFGVTPSSVSKWKNGQSTMSDEVGIQAAKALGLDEEKVLLDLHIERTSGNVASPVWRSIRDKLEMAVAPAVVAFAGYAGGSVFGLPLV